MGAARLGVSTHGARTRSPCLHRRFPTSRGPQPAQTRQHRGSANRATDPGSPSPLPDSAGYPSSPLLDAAIPTPAFLAGSRGSRASSSSQLIPGGGSGTRITTTSSATYWASPTADRAAKVRSGAGRQGSKMQVRGRKAGQQNAGQGQVGRAAKCRPGAGRPGSKMQARGR